MKRSIVFCVLWVAMVTALYPEVVATFPELARPLELRVHKGYVFISDQSSVFVYDVNTFKLVRKLFRRGDGPEEFKGNLRIAFTSDKLVFYDSYKIIVYSEDFNLIKEIRERSSDRVNPIGDNFALDASRVIDGKEYRVFGLYNGKFGKIRDLVLEQEDRSLYDFFFSPWSRCRSWNDKIFVAQPRKGFYINVFDKNGKKLYQINKDVKPVKAEEKHREAYIEELVYLVGRNRVERFRARGNFKRPMMEFMPPIKNFWVANDRIYVRTYDITESEEKYIIMDLKGNILKTVFLPETSWETLTFSQNKFYYLAENEEDEVWDLHVIRLPL